ncbi:MAG: hypothetical protein P1U52_05985 [Porticoccaceae bacterium]|nr:hypothetical protein [Porticoccaceae bacterium]
MKTNDEYKLPFGCLKCPADNIIEMIIDEGVEINVAMVKVLHATVEQLVGDEPAGFIVHKLNPYSVSFDAQQIIGDLPGIVVSAVVAYNHFGEMTAQQVIAMSEVPEADIAIFPTLDNAIFWLQKRLSALP